MLTPPNELQALYEQIEDIYREVKELRSEAADIASSSNIPDAAMQLNDVLEHTEQATIDIIDAATAIGSSIEGSTLSDDDKATITEHIGRIYESCGFQDISGQRIKKVLKHVNELESKLVRLAETARGQQQASTETVSTSLMNGPALTEAAPSQADVDDLFKQA